MNNRGQAAAEIAWDTSFDLTPYEVVVVNGGDPDEASFQALIRAAKLDAVSLVYTGTWAVDRGGIRILERYTDRVVVGEQGYGDSRVKLVGFDTEHPLFRGMPKPAKILVNGSYYSVLDEYAGIDASNMTVKPESGGDTIVGLGVGYDWWTEDSVEVLLSSTAVSETQGPGMGWTRHHKRLLMNAVRWAANATAPAGWDDGSTDEVAPQPEVTPEPTTDPTPDPTERPRTRPSRRRTRPSDPGPDRADPGPDRASGEPAVGTGPGDRRTAGARAGGRRDQIGPRARWDPSASGGGWFVRRYPSQPSATTCDELAGA